MSVVESTIAEHFISIREPRKPIFSRNVQATEPACLHCSCRPSPMIHHECLPHLHAALLTSSSLYFPVLSAILALVAHIGRKTMPDDPNLSFQALFQALDFAIVAVDQAGRVLYLNPQAERLTGWSADMVLGKPCRSLLASSGSSHPCASLRNRGDERLVDLNTERSVVLQWAGSVLDSSGKSVVTLVSIRSPQAELVERTARVSLTSLDDPLRDIVGRSPAIRLVLDTIRRLARSEANVLITGESGTGKELVARAVHALSRRAEGPFVALNCAALASNLVESELFGHVRGAFTGAVRDRAGAVEMARRGTFFLD